MVVVSVEDLERRFFRKKSLATALSKILPARAALRTFLEGIASCFDGLELDRATLRKTFYLLDEIVRMLVLRSGKDVEQVRSFLLSEVVGFPARRVAIRRELSLPEESCSAAVLIKWLEHYEQTLLAVFCTPSAPSRPSRPVMRPQHASR